jgi:hypothetical protein
VERYLNKTRPVHALKMLIHSGALPIAAEITDWLMMPALGDHAEQGAVRRAAMVPNNELVPLYD